MPAEGAAQSGSGGGSGHRRDGGDPRGEERAARCPRPTTKTGGHPFPPSLSLRSGKGEAAPSADTCPMLSCTDALSLALMSLLVAVHLRGMYRSMLTPSELCMPALMVRGVAA